MLICYTKVVQVEGVMLDLTHKRLGWTIEIRRWIHMSSLHLSAFVYMPGLGAITITTVMETHQLCSGQVIIPLMEDISLGHSWMVAEESVKVSP